MWIRLVILVFALQTSCMRDSAQCLTDADCFNDERCTDAVCELRPIKIEAGAVQSGVALSEAASQVAIELDAEDRPHIFALTHGVLTHTTWDGLRWGTRPIAELDWDLASFVTAFDDQQGFTVAAHGIETPIRLFASTDGQAWSETILGEKVLAAHLAVSSSITALCYLNGSVEGWFADDPDALALEVALRAGGTWEFHEVQASGPAPNCRIAISDGGSELVLLAEEYDAGTSNLRMARSRTTPTSLIDLTLSPPLLEASAVDLAMQGHEVWFLVDRAEALGRSLVAVEMARDGRLRTEPLTGFSPEPASGVLEFGPTNKEPMVLYRGAEPTQESIMFSIGREHVEDRRLVGTWSDFKPGSDGRVHRVTVLSDTVVMEVGP